jgi:prevent-host-death family protein
MKNIDLFEAKQKLSELVDRASSGERIGITRRGRLAAFLVPARSEVDLEDVFPASRRFAKARSRSQRA